MDGGVGIKQRLGRGAGLRYSRLTRLKCGCMDVVCARPLHSGGARGKRASQPQQWMLAAELVMPAVVMEVNVAARVGSQHLAAASAK